MISAWSTRSASRRSNTNVCDNVASLPTRCRVSGLSGHPAACQGGTWLLGGTMEAREHAPHMCGTCHRMVDWWEPADGSAGRWQHGAQDQQADHEVEPVPVDETVRGRCDFCGTDN